jgi:thiamine biosynthesis lipoprotein
MSTNIEESEVSCIKKNAGIQAVAVREETFFVIKRALFFAEISGGAFDPTIAPLVKLWGFGKEEDSTAAAETLTPPDAIEIQKCLSLLGWREVLLDEGQRTVFLPRAGMALDLGGIAKGYAADYLAEFLRAEGVESAILDLGGNIYALGYKKTGSLLQRLRKTKWKIGVQDAHGERGQYTEVVEVSDQTVVTSGTYERYIEAGGKRFHHILSAATGAPVENGLASVTVIYENSADADALSTALFVLGESAGEQLLKRFPGVNVIYQR